MGDFDCAMMVMTCTNLTSFNRNTIIAVVDFEPSKGLSERVIKQFRNIYRNLSGSSAAAEKEKEDVFYGRGRPLFKKQYPQNQQHQGQHQQNYQRPRSVSKDKKQPWKGSPAREQEPMVQQQQQQQPYQRHRSQSPAVPHQQQKQPNTSRYNLVLSIIFATNSERILA